VNDRIADANTERVGLPRVTHCPRERVRNRKAGRAPLRVVTALEMTQRRVDNLRRVPRRVPIVRDRRILEGQCRERSFLAVVE
jgi:hypothetical protein